MVIAHEMAHMWFGDLVTLRWWDDIWLNESFAEYMGYRILTEATRFTEHLDRLRVAPQGLGLRRRPAALHPPRRPRPSVADTDAAPAQLRRHLLRQGRLARCANSSPGSARRTSSPASTPTSPAHKLRQRHPRRLARPASPPPAGATSTPGPSCGCAARRSTPCVPRSPWTPTAATPRWPWCRPRPSRAPGAAPAPIGVGLLRPMDGTVAARRGRHRPRPPTEAGRCSVS